MAKTVECGHATRALAQRRTRGSVRRAAIAGRWFVAAGAGVRSARLFVAVPRRTSSGWRTFAFVRDRSGAFSGRYMVGDRRPHARSFRFRLCLAESSIMTRALPEAMRDMHVQPLLNY